MPNRGRTRIYCTVEQLTPCRRIQLGHRSHQVRECAICPHGGGSEVIEQTNGRKRIGYYFTRFGVLYFFRIFDAIA